MTRNGGGDTYPRYMSPNSSHVRRSADRRGLTNFFATAVSCALVAGAMLLHAWVRTRVTEQGYTLSRLSAEYRDLTREHEALQLKAAELRSPQRIEELARTKLGMSAPALDRVVVLVGGQDEAGFARRRAEAAGRSIGEEAGFARRRAEAAGRSIGEEAGFARRRAEAAGRSIGDQDPLIASVR